MDSDSLFTIFIIVVLIGLSAYFSATETAFSSLNRIRIKNAAEKGSKRAKLVLAMEEDYNKTLSTILVGNNVINIALASIATVLFTSWFGARGATVSTIVITILVLVFGEITPKNLAKDSAEKWATFAAPVLYMLSILLTPVNFLFDLWKRLLGRIFKTSPDDSITEEELLSIVDEAEQDGALDTDDSEMIRTAFDFNDSRVADILTPRVEVEAISHDATIDDLAELFLSTGYTRIPVYQESLDHILGVIHLHDFFDAVHGGTKTIEDITMPLVFTPPTTKINDLLRMLQAKKSHLAIVTDEYGGTVGIVTMEDILEELVGEIWDEHDEVEEDVRLLADGRHIVRGRADIDDVLDLYGFEKETHDATTVSGWLTEKMGRMPKECDTFTFNGLLITVLKTGGHRVQECSFEQLPPPATDEDE